MEPLSSLLQDKSYPEQILYDRGYLHVAGVDEVGRGPLAGPVVASAVILPRDFFHPDIKDSKTLTESKRKELYSVINENALSWNWGLVDHDEIDRINILRATLAAMKKAVEALCIKPDYIIVDGTHSFSAEAPQTTIKKGDTKSLSIAAASIMAKVTRDLIMKKYHCLYPQYNFEKNKGYGTAEHLKALIDYACCPVHRRSFNRVIEHRIPVLSSKG